MKRFIAFVKKEFWHIFRDYRTMMILFVMPIAQILIFGFVISNDINNASIGVLDKSKDASTREIISRLTSSGYFSLKENLVAENQIEPALRQGRVRAVMVFEPDFETKLVSDGLADIQIVADASDANNATVIANYATGIIQDYVRDQNRYSGNSFMTIVPEVKMYYNENLEGVYMSVPGIMAMILILVSAMMTSISITREKEFGSMELLLISPLKPVQIILGKVTPYVVLAFINALTILIIGVWIFKMPLQGSLVLLLFVCLLYIFMALSLGIFFSTIAKNQMVAMFLSLFALMLPTILLSGFIFPIENMPLPLQWLSNIMPPRWFILLIKKIMLKGSGFYMVMKEIGILLGITMFFILMSIRKFKIRLE